MSGRLTDVLKGALAVLGVASALLTVLFAIRSSYLFLAERGERNAEIESWLPVATTDYRRAADNHELMSLLHISEYAWEQIYELDPADPDIELSVYLGLAESTATQIENIPFEPGAWRDYLSELAADGWRLRDQVTEPGKRGRLLLALARLEGLLYTPSGAENELELLREAVDLQPMDPAPRYLLARKLLDQPGKHQEAEAMLQELVAEHPEDPRYAVALGRQLLSSDQPAEAFQHLRKAASTDLKQPGFERRDAIDRARSLLAQQMFKALENQKNVDFVDDSFVDAFLADRLGRGDYYLAGADAVLAGVYWWQRGHHRRASQLFFDSYVRFRKDAIPDLVQLEMKWLNLPLEALPPSIEELRAVVPRYQRPAFDSVAEAFAAHMDLLQERLFAGTSVLGAQVQYWPGEGLLLRRVVPGYLIEQLGARPGDWLVGVNGTAVGSLEALVLEAAGNKLVSVSVIRNGEQLDLPATKSG